MWLRLEAWCAVAATVGLGCGPSSTAGTASESPLGAAHGEPSGREERPAASPTEGHHVPRCGAPDASTRELKRFDALRAGAPALHHVVVGFEPSSREWLPVKQIDMPLHHATHIAWTNQGDFEALAGADAVGRIGLGEQLLFTFRVLSRHIEHRADENVFFVEYRAHIELVCSASAPTSRAEGALVAPIGLDTTECPALTAKVTEAARALGACTRDTECAITGVGVCSVEGLGCYWVAAHRDRSMSDLAAAIRGLEIHPCPMAECDCPTPPTSARCASGTCVAR